tara:strand:- start:14 stop:202 length:189 start_codon:yes stop_codon:yes gene_type:complete
MNKENIQSAKKIQPSSSITIDTIKVTMTDNEILFVPITTENADYVTLQEWVADGNTIAEADS